MADREAALRLGDGDVDDLPGCDGYEGPEKSAGYAHEQDSDQVPPLAPQAVPQQVPTPQRAIREGRVEGVAERGKGRGRLLCDGPSCLVDGIDDQIGRGAFGDQRHRPFLVAQEAQEGTTVTPPPVFSEVYAPHPNPRGPRDLVERVAGHAVGQLGTAKLGSYLLADHLTGGQQRIVLRDARTHDPRRLEHGTQLVCRVPDEVSIGLGAFALTFLAFRSRTPPVASEDRQHLFVKTVQIGPDLVSSHEALGVQTDQRGGACGFQPCLVCHREQAVLGDRRKTRIAEEAQAPFPMTDPHCAFVGSYRLGIAQGDLLARRHGLGLLWHQDSRCRGNGQAVNPTL